MTAGSAVAAAVRDILSKVLHNNLNNITIPCLPPNIKHLEGKMIHVFLYTQMYTPPTHKMSTLMHTLHTL